MGQLRRDLVKNNMRHYSVAIIGAGPAGIFTAYYILNNSTTANVLLVDKGPGTQNRTCCENCQSCPFRSRCNVLCGVGGAGLFSDGKLVLDLHSGGKIDAIASLTEIEKVRLKDYIVETLKKYDGVSEMGPDLTAEKQKSWEERFKKQGLSVRHYDVLHMGTSNLQHITQNFINDLLKSPRFTLRTDCQITDICDIENQESILCTKGGEKFVAANVVFSVGKTGSGWLRNIFEGKKIPFLKTKTYIGIRLEASHDSIKELFEYSFDPKIFAFYGEKKVKTHCFCRQGDIRCSNYMGYSVIGGHSKFTANNTIPIGENLDMSNFNVLVSTDVEKKEIINLLGEMADLNPNGGIVQRLSDFLYPEKSGRIFEVDNMKRCKSGNVRAILDSFDHMGEIISDFIIRMGKVVPGVAYGGNLVYAPALEWFMDSVKVNSHMETIHKGWFAVGDGAGLSQGIVHAAATGIIAANEICLRMGD